MIRESDNPPSGVELILAGEGFTQEGHTNRRGELTLPLLALPGKRARSLFVVAPEQLATGISMLSSPNWPTARRR